LADNDKNGAQNEFILPLRLTVFIHKLMVEQLSYAPVGGSMDASAFVSMVVGEVRTTAALLISSVQHNNMYNFIGMAKPKKSKT
jgi:hypothetical protein